MSKKTELNEPMVIWDQHQIPEDSIHTWEIGPLKIWCKKISGELQIAHKRTESVEQEVVAEEDLQNDLNWTRWALEEKKIIIELNPLLPDRSVVVKPETSFWLTKNVKARIYVRVPLWIQMNLAGRKAKALTEIPTVVLSNTWFGDFFDGELCYWLSSSARRNFEIDPSRFHLAICPIQLTNESDEDLLVEKICLRVLNLSLFEDEGQLWSDVIKISYKGKNEGSQIAATGKAPAEAKGARLIGTPRQIIRKSLTARTFASLIELSGFKI